MAHSTDNAPTLHVLTLTPFFPSTRNEVSGCFVAEPIEALRQFGVRSSVIAVSPLHYPSNRPSSIAPAQWVRYPQIPGTFGLSSSGKLLYARLLEKVRRLNSANPIAVIHAHAALPCGHAAALLSAQLKIPFVVTIHGLDVFNSCARLGVMAARRRAVSVKVYAAAQNIICVSRKVQEILKTGTPTDTRSAIVHNGVNPCLFAPNSDAVSPSDPEILVVGTLLASKGQAVVLRAIAALKTSFPGLRCRIIGEGPDQADFEALSRDLGLSTGVQFVGRKSRLEVAEAMRRCSIFALPSRNEGLGCVYLEAMSCGKPVIACRGQGIDDVIEHEKNGWLVPVDGVEQLAQGLAALLASAELRARIGTAARQTILTKLTLSHQADQLASIYRHAVSHFAQ